MSKNVRNEEASVHVATTLHQTSSVGHHVAPSFQCRAPRCSPTNTYGRHTKEKLTSKTKQKNETNA